MSTSRAGGGDPSILPASRTGASSARAGRVLVAGIGHHDLRDLSFGPIVLERMKREPWPDGVELEDLSYGPVAVMHNLDDRPPYDRFVLLSSVRRGRAAGTVTSYRWNGRLPGEEEIQARIAEAVTGIISLDNFLVVLTWFRKLPADVRVIEVEAADEGWGDGFSPEVERAIPCVLDEVRALIA